MYITYYPPCRHPTLIRGSVGSLVEVSGTSPSDNKDILPSRSDTPLQKARVLVIRSLHPHTKPIESDGINYPKSFPSNTNLPLIITGTYKLYIPSSLTYKTPKALTHLFILPFRNSGDVLHRQPIL